MRCPFSFCCFDNTAPKTVALASTIEKKTDWSLNLCMTGEKIRGQFSQSLLMSRITNKLRIELTIPKSLRYCVLFNELLKANVDEEYKKHSSRVTQN